MNVYAVHMCNWEEYLASLTGDDAMAANIRSDKLWPLGPTFLGHAL